MALVVQKWVEYLCCACMPGEQEKLEPLVIFKRAFKDARCGRYFGPRRNRNNDQLVEESSSSNGQQQNGDERDQSNYYVPFDPHRVAPR